LDDAIPLSLRVGSEARAGNSVLADWLNVRIPRVLHAGDDPECGSLLSGRSGTARILLDVLRGFLEESQCIDGPARVRLSGVVLDLLTAVLAEQGEQAADDVVLQRIQQFAESNLADAELTGGWRYRGRQHVIRGGITMKKKYPELCRRGDDGHRRPRGRHGFARFRGRRLQPLVEPHRPGVCQPR
ncbi:MAG TPA: hypothetical protein VN408_41620, partial [Actinoplanes sp.]|nr:hypothetical protein [Actinoplanes sp.]